MLINLKQDYKVKCNYKNAILLFDWWYTVWHRILHLLLMTTNSSPLVTTAPSIYLHFGKTGSVNENKT